MTTQISNKPVKIRKNRTCYEYNHYYNNKVDCGDIGDSLNRGELSEYVDYQEERELFLCQTELYLQK